MPIDESIVMPVTGQIRTLKGWFDYNSIKLRQHIMNDDMFVIELLWNNIPEYDVSIYISKVDLIEFCWKVVQSTEKEGTPCA